MDNNLETRVKTLEKEQQASLTEIVRWEERLKSLNAEKDKVLAEITALGIKEEELLSKYDELQASIKETLDKVEDNRHA